MSEKKKGFQGNKRVGSAKERRACLLRWKTTVMRERVAKLYSIQYEENARMQSVSKTV
ncbi:hypothetical protein POSPLADRAFT_1038449 [Postia placenta MAD-698-R-SB12]|uniref:Uncharacterized protein n=2 Tax=Rhodonia placenta TaxID=104341 RepID=A0A1X6NBD0_9APHY|nr:hypothetical protein POSPLADRAFT_1038449 [Postia placenta MAD-698-R-SB12]OSX65948.1 hypothetical protein POSPLADRAFT_1038449 [Postia placenta MAD-698-R-SB12]